MARTRGEDAGLLRGVAEEDLLGDDPRVRPCRSFGSGVDHHSRHQEQLHAVKPCQEVLNHHPVLGILDGVLHFGRGLEGCQDVRRFRDSLTNAAMLRRLRLELRIIKPRYFSNPE